MDILSEGCKKTFNDKKFICPKCLSFFGSEAVPITMLKKKSFTFGSAIRWSIFLSVLILVFNLFRVFLVYGRVIPSTTTVGFGHLAFNGQSYYHLNNPLPVVFAISIYLFIILSIILGFISLLIPDTEQKCPICKRTGKFVLANSKLGMEYVNKKVINDLSNKESNSQIENKTRIQNTLHNNQSQADSKIKDAYTNWRQNRK